MADLCLAGCSSLKLRACSENKSGVSSGASPVLPAECSHATKYATLQTMDGPADTAGLVTARQNVICCLLPASGRHAPFVSCTRRELSCNDDWSFKDSGWSRRNPGAVSCFTAIP